MPPTPGAGLSSVAAGAGAAPAPPFFFSRLAIVMRATPVGAGAAALRIALHQQGIYLGVLGRFAYRGAAGTNKP